MSVPARILTPTLELRVPRATDTTFLPPSILDSNELRVVVDRDAGKAVGWLYEEPERRLALHIQDASLRAAAVGAWLRARARARAHDAADASGTIDAQARQNSVAVDDSTDLTVTGADPATDRDLVVRLALQPDAAGWRPSPRTATALAVQRVEELGAYDRWIDEVLLALGLAPDDAALPPLPRFAEAEVLASIGADVFDRQQFLAPPAAEAWHALVAAAAQDGVTIQPVSAFRSGRRQRRIIERKLAGGQRLERILRVSALPGFSEHHSGGALDLTAPGVPVLEEAFAATEAYRWLRTHAGTFGFRESYPPANAFGLAFEPWHWCHEPTARAAVAALARRTADHDPA